MIRSFACLVFALVLGLTGQSMAFARGQAVATGEMVLCTGGGIVSVPVDAEGNPTGPAHICPDCALSLIVMAEAGSKAPAALIWCGMVLVVPDAPVVMAKRHETGLPRGPPMPHL